MPRQPRLFSIGVSVALALCAFSPSATPVTAAQIEPITLDFGRALTWRLVGPLEPGRVTAADGDPARPGVFYAASDGAGVWKTTDYGASWQPIFDAPPAGTVTAIAVAAGRSTVIYAAADAQTGSGASSSMPAVWRSTDAGATWQAMATPGGARVSHIKVDPRNHDHLFVATTTDASGAGGLYTSNDGGAAFVRAVDAGNIADVMIHAARPSTIVAVRATATTAGSSAASTIVRSTDNGVTWSPAGAGLPGPEGPDPTHVRLATAPDSDRMFAAVPQSSHVALYRSDDFGATWAIVNGRAVPLPSGDADIDVAAAAPGTLHIAAGSLWKSDDGGATFTQSATAGDRGDFLVWSHPSMAGVMLAAGNHGASITVNDGASWIRATSQATSNISRLSVDSSFPYRICASIAAGVSCAVRLNQNGVPSARDWDAVPPVLAEQIAADPLDGEVLFGGDVVRYDRRTGQSLDVGRTGAPGGDDAHRASIPLAFSADGRWLYAGARSVWRTNNAGQQWTDIGPDPTVASPGRRGQVSALAVSPIDARTIWTGFDDGRLHVTRDAGVTWAEAQVPAGSLMVHAIEPSRFDTNSVYAIVSAGPPSSTASKLLRTRDNGATWTDIGANIPGPGRIHAVREDPFRRGLLFAGTDRSIFLSFDDGERWQSMRWNLPSTPVRDLVVKDADLIVGTGGRGVWMIEDISVLRQVTADVARADAFLFRPAQTWRLRAGSPRAGAERTRTFDAGAATFTYLLGSTAGEVRLEVIETATGDVIRRFSSGTADALPTTPGLHRVTWDLRYTHPEPQQLSAVRGTPVLPGTYQVRLSVDGRSIRQAIAVRMDPRVRASTTDLTAQRDLGRAIDTARASLRAAIDEPRLAPNTTRGARNAGILAALGELNRLAGVLQQADVRPSARLEAAVEEAIVRATAALEGIS